MSATPPTLTPYRLPDSPSPGTEGSGYIGRFAPSPSGPLHFGSLVSALASYLDAKANGGKWLVRMEDLDPPREQPGAASTILKTLDDHGLHWDGEIVYQSQRSQAYEACLDALLQARFAYYCTCSRQDLTAMGGIYDGRCRNRPVDSHHQICSLRLKLYDLPDRPTAEIIQFDDLIQGTQVQNLRTQAGDQILKRRDGFYAYQLAVVVDDIAQGITHIIRGSDLLEVTGRQLFFFDLLGAPLPQFGHVPLAIQPNGQKLSKQNHAKAIDGKLASKNLWRGLEFLGQNPPADLADASTSECLDWALHNWQRQAVQGLSHLYQEE
ncbi:tRNA glutamyl-Q(34) synthetase GluQRS [Cellvibrio fibrivorans]|uniref:Glutamyl-Q tRNA(Asp) synthetase n=1 Tax=Cellvibrio fibrivorans TaxID=126350 RepID=A0ABU1USN8_9GAMM|nr:tRNA glutamyl-Q(34) synthetase GluQRS [Cellvibrio fibrivorans]MDR7088199.1 glutamyl-Q tRNA(Asp) synthetase [Cellvibrio fibrivorans]